MAEPLAYAYLDSPIGRLLAIGSAQGLRSVRFATEKRPQVPPPGAQLDDAPFAAVFDQLTRYFSGGLTAFDLAIDQPGTAFQRSVWRALRRIPYGATTTYGTLAKQLGRPKASRAVGAANGSNQLPIIVPCHRVIGANNALTGFAGGLPIKRFLLEHERRHAPDADGQGQLGI